jgi:hypothetical protein
MQEFIAKHQDKIAGTLSGFDRLVFRGHLRSIGHPQGMMTYLLVQPGITQEFWRPCRRGHRAPEGSFLSRSQGVRTTGEVSELQPDRQRDHRPQHPGSRWRARRPGVRAQLSRTLLEIPDPSQSPDEKTGVAATLGQMPVPLPLPDPSRLRLSQCPHSNLVPLLHSDLPQRTGMAGATDACRRSGLPAA